MSPDVLTSVAAIPIPGVVLIAFLLWAGVSRALRVLGLSAADRMPLLAGAAALLGTWLVLAFWLGARGFFHESSTEALPMVALGFAVPLVVALAILASSKTARDVVAATPQHLLIGVQLYRVIGAVFLVMSAQGRMPGAFAIPAGWGDLLIGVSAPVVAWLYRGDATRWRGLAILWNVVGLVDLGVAVAMGVVTAPGRFQQFALEAPNSLITAFPLVLVPTVLVPASVLLHALSLGLLRRGRIRQLVVA